VPEGDTIHRIARRFDAALVDRPLGRVEAPNPRSPLHHRAGELRERRIELAEARGKHLLLHFEGGLVVHNHLGVGGRWRLTADGRLPARPRSVWLLLASGPAVAALSGSKVLRLVSESRIRNDPLLARLGPDPLAPGFDERSAAARLLASEPTEPVGAALQDQELLAGVGNVIRIEALWLSRIDPWRPVGDLTTEEGAELVGNVASVMRTSLRTGRRPKRIYGSLARRPCPRCGAGIRGRGQGDANRVTYWCGRCQR
jgi:endonuclease-8